MPFKPGWKKELKDKQEKEAKESADKQATVPPSPIYRSFYIEKQTGSWRLVIADLQDDKVISKKVKEAENKAHSLDMFKIAFAEHYYFGK